MLRKTPIALAMSIAWGVSPLAAMAQQSTPATSTLPEVKVSGQQETKDYVPDVSTVGAKVPTPLRDIPQSVTVINRAVLDAQGAASLQDALRNVPGITLGAAEGGQIGNNINLRGFSARTDVYLDGVRDRGQYYRDTYYLESVEVLKGPSSMLFGRGSTGGVINQVSKQAELRDRNEVSATLGTSDYARTTADFNRKLSDTSAFRVNLSALLQHNRDMPDYGFLPVNKHPIEVRNDNYYGLTDDRTVQDVAVVGADIKHKISPTLTLRNHTQYSWYNTDARETYPNAVGTLSGSTFTPLPTATAGPWISCSCATPVMTANSGISRCTTKPI